MVEHCYILILIIKLLNSIAAMFCAFKIAIAIRSMCAKVETASEVVSQYVSAHDNVVKILRKVTLIIFWNGRILLLMSSLKLFL